MSGPVTVRALLAAATDLLIEAQNRLDGDPDLECDDPLEDDDPDHEHDGQEHEEGV